MSKSLFKVIPSESRVLKSSSKNRKFIKIFDLLSGNDYVIKLSTKSKIYYSFIPLFVNHSPIYISAHECFNTWSDDNFEAIRYFPQRKEPILFYNVRNIKEETVKQNYPEFII